MRLVRVEDPVRFTRKEKTFWCESQRHTVTSKSNKHVSIDMGRKAKKALSKIDTAHCGLMVVRFFSLEYDRTKDTEIADDRAHSGGTSCEHKVMAGPRR